jgi:hypothetical protein
VLTPPNGVVDRVPKASISKASCFDLVELPSASSLVFAPGGATGAGPQRFGFS